jgi:hypothetical protein
VIESVAACNNKRMHAAFGIIINLIDYSRHVLNNKLANLNISFFRWQAKSAGEYKLGK